MSFSGLRRWHWGLILLCSFLPIVEGCNKKVIYPYREFLHPDQWLQTTIFLYPIVLFLISAFIWKVVKPAGQFGVSWTTGYLLFVGFSYMLTEVVKEMPEWYSAILVGLWGIIAFGLLKARSQARLIDLIGFSLTALALWFFPFVFLFREKILYGGWLYIYAGGFITLTYIAEFLIHAQSLLVGSKRRIPCDLKI